MSPGPRSTCARPLRAAAGTALALAAAALAAADVAGQRPPRAVTAVDADSIRVGEPFVVGITVAAGRPAEVVFPPSLPLSDPLEQRGAARVRPSEERGEWRAYYTLVAWRSGRFELPTLEVELRDDSGAGPRTLTVAPTAVLVRTVLPEEEDLELREARPFLRLSRPIWPWLLGALVLLALAAWWWRRRRRAAARAPAAGPTDPGERALAALDRLRRAWESGELAAPEMYDRLEGALRRYAGATRPWEPGRPLRGLANGDRELVGALELSTLVRFARLRPPEGQPARSIDAASDFVRRERRAAAAARERRGREAAQRPGGEP